MSKKYDVAYAQTIKEGEKPRWIPCGAVFETSKGFRLKLDVVPVNCNGWFSLFEPKPREDRPQRQQEGAQTEGAPFNDDIPW